MLNELYQIFVTDSSAILFPAEVKQFIFLAHSAMAFRISFLRVFCAKGSSKTPALLLGLGASAIGIGSAVSTISLLSAREKPKLVDTSTFMAEPLTAPDVLESSMDDFKSCMEVMILGVQAEICKKLAAIDGQEFRVDRWLRNEGGGGISCVLQDGKSLHFMDKFLRRTVAYLYILIHFPSVLFCC